MLWLFFKFNAQDLYVSGKNAHDQKNSGTLVSHQEALCNIKNISASAYKYINKYINNCMSQQAYPRYWLKNWFWSPYGSTLSLCLALTVLLRTYMLKLSNYCQSTAFAWKVLCKRKLFKFR